MYVDESDQDDDFETSRKRRKRRSAGMASSTEDAAVARCMERGVRLQNSLSETMGVRGPLVNLSIASSATELSLPPGAGGFVPIWKRRKRKVAIDQQKRVSTELDELICMHRQFEESDHAGLRRSTRATDHPDFHAEFA